MCLFFLAKEIGPLKPPDAQYDYFICTLPPWITKNPINWHNLKNWIFCSRALMPKWKPTCNRLSMSALLAEMEKNIKNKDTFLKSLGQERWLKPLVLPHVILQGWQHRHRRTREASLLSRSLLSPSGNKAHCFPNDWQVGHIQDSREIPPILSCCISKQICHVGAVAY